MCLGLEFRHIAWLRFDITIGVFLMIFTRQGAFFNAEFFKYSNEKFISKTVKDK